MSQNTLVPRALIALGDVSYNEDLKQQFARYGRTLLKRIVAELRLKPGEYSIRYNAGGIAVSGEVTLHSDRIYVQVFQGCISRGATDIMYRTVRDRSDYTGGVNHFVGVGQLAEPERQENFLRTLRAWQYPAEVAHAA